MRPMDEVFAALQRSAFRSRFSLGGKEAEYLRRKGLATILEHGRTFIEQRLAPARPANDGRQTPTKGHPFFIAQHATATCCRRCLQRWHRIEQGTALSQRQIQYILAINRRWLLSQCPELEDRPQAGLSG